MCIIYIYIYIYNIQRIYIIYIYIYIQGIGIWHMVVPSRLRSFFVQPQKGQSYAASQQPTSLRPRPQPPVGHRAKAVGHQHPGAADPDAQPELTESDVEMLRKGQLSMCSGSLEQGGTNGRETTWTTFTCIFIYIYIHILCLHIYIYI